eukprot:9498777-Pyramimonas_sp.AAC.1
MGTGARRRGHTNEKKGSKGRWRKGGRGPNKHWVPYRRTAHYDRIAWYILKSGDTSRRDIEHEASATSIWSSCFPDNSTQFWAMQSKAVHIIAWNRCLALLGIVLRWLALIGVVCRCLGLLSIAWHWFALLGTSWHSCLVLFGNVCQCLALLGVVWNCFALLGTA